VFAVAETLTPLVFDEDLFNSILQKGFVTVPVPVTSVPPFVQSMN
jgi:hypothetical protein